MKTLTTVQKQSRFCFELMCRLNEKIEDAELYYGHIKHHTRMENDVVRLRRELTELADMLRQYGYER